MWADFPYMDCCRNWSGNDVDNGEDDEDDEDAEDAEGDAVGHSADSVKAAADEQNIALASRILSSSVRYLCFFYK